MRKKIVAGNWKMNLLWQDANSLVENLVARQDQIPSEVSVLLAPPAIYLAALREIAGDKMKLAGQNCSEHESGAFTGEVSAAMLKSVGIDYCIVGHSERRQLFGETNEVVADKTRACLEAEVKPIVCFGELLEERKAGDHFSVVKSQVEAALSGLSNDQLSEVILAYEPVWAIGTGETASAEEAQEIHATVRKLLTEMFNQEIADNTPILYGGSVKPANAESLFSCEDVDGGLVGGASLKAEDFIEIIKAAGK